MDLARRLVRKLKPLAVLETGGAMPPRSEGRSSRDETGPGGIREERAMPEARLVPAGPTRPDASIGPGSTVTVAIADVARRLDLTPAELVATQVAYRRIVLPKRSGGTREIDAPGDELRRVQRLILRRLLARLPAHPAAIGFERGRSVVEHARLHAGRAVVVRLDVEDYFPSITDGRVREFFSSLGWDASATDLLTRLTTHEGRLPQGAPTSPRLANLLDRRLDARLAGWAERHGVRYSRYADDLTFSFSDDDPALVHAAIRLSQQATSEQGYRLHMKKKLHVRRRHQRQVVGGLVVNGLVVNTAPRLPRERRRWLRAVEHRAATGGKTSITEERLRGWRAYRAMVERSDTDSR